MRVKNTIALQLRAISKWALSFFKSDWDLKDYPVHVRTVKPNPESPFRSSRFKFHPFIASIDKWGLNGFGDTMQDALQELKRTFAERTSAMASEGKPLPRPGTEVPLELASTARIDAHRELADDFVRQVLGLDWAFISDGSSLWDFHTEETNQKYITKIKEVYGVTIDDIESATLCEILDRIAARNAASKKATSE